MLTLLYLALLACGGPAVPTELSDCEGLSEGMERDECYAVVLPAMFAKDAQRADTLTQERVQDSLVRDFVYLEVAREIDPGGGRWCMRIETLAVRERCEVLMRRPHLQRELLQAHPPGGEPPAGAVPEGGLPGSGAFSGPP